MNQVMLRTDALAKTFTLHLQGGVRLPVLSGVGLELHAGECVVLSGPSGVGKSTLMRSLYGNYRAESGHIIDPPSRRDGRSRQQPIPAQFSPSATRPSAMSASSSASCRACRRSMLSRRF